MTISQSTAQLKQKDVQLMSYKARLMYTNKREESVALVRLKHLQLPPIFGLMVAQGSWWGVMFADGCQQGGGEPGTKNTKSKITHQ